MSEKNGRIPRIAMSAEERRWRSRLTQLVSQHRFMHATLLRRRRVCGKPNCRCTRGQKHESLYLMLRKQGKLHQLYVPKQWEQAVQQWVDNDHEIRDLMEQISQLHWQRVKNRQG
ncbi:MAG: hypothetical protein QGG09_14315 [Pirellulaceae bacterium]|jgi:hypothetical protein|nr:hypothetical protein [Pirellulaceae bacterium]